MAGRRDFLAGLGATTLGARAGVTVGSDGEFRVPEKKGKAEKPGYLTGKRGALLKRWAALQNERTSWWSHWQEISTYLLPRSGRFLTEEQDRGRRKHNNIYDSTATRALQTLASGMMAGATSPARPWFRLTTPDPGLASKHHIKIWLDEVRDLMMQRFQRSNTYRALAQVYLELGAFGTACSIITPHPDKLIHHHPLTAGQFCLATDPTGKIVTLFRQYELTVSEMVREFGVDKLSPSTRNKYDNNNLDTRISIVHAIEPNYDRDQTKVDDLNMAFRSCYFEEKANEHDDLLRVSGFRDFPAVVPRWSAPGGDIYGSSPAMDALGDIKGLQHKALRLAQGIDYQTKPPVAITGELKDRDIDMLPGGRTFMNTAAPNGGIKPLFEANNLNLNYLLGNIQDDRRRIHETFFSDMFLMLANAGPDQRMTATEVAERHEEKLLMLGPVLERLHNELLEPLIDLAFVHLVQAGTLPPAPPELSGVDLNVEFVSMLAQAQRAIGSNSVDRFLGTLGGVAQMKPEVLDKLDADELVDAYADMLGVDPKLIVASDKVAMIRDARARAEAAAAQTAQAQAQAATAKDLSQSNTSDQNALTDVVGMFSGLNA